MSPTIKSLGRTRRGIRARSPMQAVTASARVAKTLATRLEASPSGCPWGSDSTSARTINVQKMLLLRIFQIVRAGPRAAGGMGAHVTMSIDDARFVAGPAATRMLATIRDRSCNMILAHTSPADLKQERQAITDNTRIKCCFRANTPDVADFMESWEGTS
jgi:hypothetical protein